MIDQLYSGIIKPRHLRIALGIFLVIFTLSLWKRYVHADELWFAEMSYYLAKTGVVKMASIRGVLGLDQQIFPFHKLHIFIGAAIVSLFGWSVYYFKIFTLLVYMGFFYVFYKFYLANSEKYTSNQIWLASLIILTSPALVNYGFLYRPEILIMTLGFLSYFLLNKFLQQGKYQWVWVSGILAGLATLTHLNGMVFLVAGVIMLGFFKRFKAVLIFGFFGLLVSSIYTYDLWGEGNFEVFMMQIKYWPQHSFEENVNFTGPLSFIQTFFIKFITEHKRYFRTEVISVLSGLFLLSLFVSYRSLLKSHKSLLIFSLTLMVSLALLGSHKVPRFLIYLYPFMAIIISGFLLKLRDYNWLWLKIVIILGIAAQLAISGKVFYNIFQRNGDFSQAHRVMMEKVPDPEARILGPWDVIFNEIGKYDLVTYYTYEFYIEKEKKEFSQQQILKKIAEDSIEYIILDKPFISINRRKWSSFFFHFKKLFVQGNIKDNPYFEFYYRDEEFLILKNKKLVSAG